MVTEEEVGTSEMHEMNMIRQPPVESGAGEAGEGSSVPTDQNTPSDLQQVIPQLEGVVSIF